MYLSNTEEQLKDPVSAKVMQIERFIDVSQVILNNFVAFLVSIKS